MGFMRQGMEGRKERLPNIARNGDLAWSIPFEGQEKGWLI
jgi:hypothetical protein